MADDLRVEVISTEDICVVECHGELDMDTVRQLERSLEAVAQDGHAEVVVDLAGVGFLDSSGLNLLARTTADLRATGRQLTIRNPSAAAQRMITISGLDRLLHIE